MLKFSSRSLMTSNTESQLQRPGLRTRPGNVSNNPRRDVTDSSQKRRRRSQAAALRKSMAELHAKQVEEAEEMLRRFEEVKRRTSYYECTTKMARIHSVM